MIGSLRLTSTKKPGKLFPWAAEIPFLQGDGLTFKSGLNILFGPNGSGKSTVLKMLATFLAAEQGGRSVVTQSWLGDLFDLGGGKDPANLFWHVTHDGQPIVHADPRKAVGIYGHGGHFDDDFMLQGLQELERRNASSGQVTSARIAHVVRMIMEQPSAPASHQASTPSKTKTTRAGPTLTRRKPPAIPDPAVFPASVEWRLDGNRVNELWVARMKVAQTLFKGSLPLGPRTLLLDEPETGFGLPWQAGFWQNVMRSAQAKDFQIIVATHSPFAVQVPGAHYIDTEQGYRAQCLGYLLETFGPATTD